MMRKPKKNKPTSKQTSEGNYSEHENRKKINKENTN